MSELAAQLRQLGVTVKILTIGDDEIVVLEAPERFTQQHAQQIRAAWDAATDHQRAVIAAGIQIAAARYEDVPDETRPP